MFTVTASKDGLAVGQAYAPKPGTILYVNDHSQFGIWVEESLVNSPPVDHWVSGPLATTLPVAVADLLPDHPDEIMLFAYQANGVRVTYKKASVDLALFLRHFQLLG